MPIPPAPEPTNPRHARLRRFIRGWVHPFALAAAILLPVRASIADWNDVPSGSMRPTIVEGDRIVVNKLAFGLRVPFTTTWLARWDYPDRGQIVTLASPADGIRLVKRVAAIAGDTVELRKNLLYINGQLATATLVGALPPARLPDGRTTPMEESTELLGTRRHAIALTPALASKRDFGPVTVPQGTIFVLGDNRDQSRDSRYLGFAPVSTVYGSVPAVAFSLDRANFYVPRLGRTLKRLP
ncbi:MAG: signal peptidase I [Phycisphaerales bacterium]